MGELKVNTTVVVVLTPVAPLVGVATDKVSGVAATKLAPTAAALVPAAMVQVDVPVHEPVHPANAYPEPAVAVSVTALELEKLPDAEVHVESQEMPLGLLFTVPEPVFVSAIWRVVVPAV